MKKALMILAALALALGLTTPAHAAETVSNASLYNSSASVRPVYFQTASSGGATWSKQPGQTHTAPTNAPILRVYVSPGCHMEITTGGLTLNLYGGKWHTWTPSNNVQTTGTETVRVRC